ncbi:MAG: type II toxin-antitoxin system death-on-curing family toxin [Vulcanimicrobiota bacterium]
MSQSEPTWLNRQFLDAAHQDQLQQHGGLSGIRDENALESALARPRNRWSYKPDTSLLELAACYCFGLATSHGYSDGNKRIAFVAMYTFLGINDLEITASQVEVVRMILAVAGGKLDEESIVQWLERFTEPYFEE